jgi:hypothetical protein
LAFIACFSSNSVAKAKTYMNEELALAVEQIRLMPPGRVWFIPVRLDDCELPKYQLGGGRHLDSLQRIDLFGPNREANLGRLVAQVMKVFGTSPATPAMTAEAIAGSTAAERGPRLAELVKAGVSDPNRIIEVEDAFLEEVRTVLEALQDSERFRVEGGPAPTVTSMVDRAQDYERLVEPISHASIALAAWGSSNELAGLATRAMARLAATTEQMRGGFTAYLYLQRYALLPVLYAGVMGAVARRNGLMLRAFAVDPTVRYAEQSVALVSGTSPWSPFQEAEMAAHVLARVAIEGGTAEERLADFEQRRAGKYYTPVSERLFRVLRPMASSLVLDDAEYGQLFDRTEGFLSMAELDYAANSDVVPEYRRGRAHWVGRIGHSERYMNANSGLASETIAEIQARREHWWPLAGGMFGGDWQRAEAAAVAWAQNVQAARERRW